MRVTIPRQLEEFQAQLVWYEARDSLLGENFVEQNVDKALQLAARCEHAEAVWLTSCFAVHKVNNKEEAREVFLEQGKEDPKALCFASVMGRPLDWDALRRSSQLGFAFAQTKMALKTRGGEEFGWAVKAAAQGERDGYYRLALCFQYGHGCEKDLAKAKENFLIAAELGHVYSIRDYGLLFDRSDPRRYTWLGKAATRDNPAMFLQEMVKHVSKFNCGLGCAKVLFAIGRALKGSVNMEKGEIFGYNAGSRIGPAKQAIAFFESQVLAVRRAVDTWTLVGRRNLVMRDVRLIVARMIWDARDEQL
jgi:hypothetical protein